MRLRLPQLFGALLLALALMPARAGLFDDEEARGRIEKLRTDFDEISKRVGVTAKNQIDFANQAETLKAEIARLRGQVEVIVNDLESTQKRQKDFYVDLDNRLRKIEAGATEAKSEDKPGAAQPADSAKETRDYEAALMAFKGGKYKDSLAGFLGFIKTYPNSTLQPAAHYWAATCHYQIREYAMAAGLFGHLASTWPNDSRAPDALLTQADALNLAGDAKGSRKALETLVEKYPASTPAQTAKMRLKAAAAIKKKP